MTFLFNVPHIAAPSPKRKKLMEKGSTELPPPPSTSGFGRTKKKRMRKGMPIATEKLAMVGGPWSGYLAHRWGLRLKRARIPT